MLMPGEPTLPARPRRPASSARLHILGWYMALLAVTLLLSLLLWRTILLAQLSDEIDAQLRQEVAELAQLSTGRDPNTGEHFGQDVAAIFDTFLNRNIPASDEAFFTLIDGIPYASTVPPLQLFDDPDIVAAWAAITEPTQAEIDTPGGRVRYLAVPVVAEDGRQGLFVVAHFMEGTHARLDRNIQTGGVIFGSVFVVVSVLAWFAAGQVLRPIKVLTEAARHVQDTDWSERIPIKGDDEIARLTRTFNDMLERLESAFVTQRRFIDDASHELRTPITIIRGHLEVMGEGAAEWDEVKHLVIDELDRMSRMVEDLLLLARAEHPDFLDAHPIDVGELTSEIAAKIAALSGEREWRMEEAAPVVMVADRHRLTQAMMNLARNAVEHSEAGSTITLGSRSQDTSVLFWIRDEGEGIPPDEQELIFQRFSRGRQGRRSSEGAGLGLAIVKMITEAHDGSVAVTSTPGQGSTFSLLLPVSGPGESQ